MSLSFGAPSSAPATGALNSGFSFGANTAKPASGFGASQPLGLFGSPAMTSQPLSFGVSSAPTGLGGSNFSFGSGGNTTTTSTGLGFGAPISSATSTGSYLGGMSSVAPTLGGFNFGTPASTASSLGFGLLGNTGTATSTPGLYGSRIGIATTQPTTAVSVGLGGVATGFNTTTDSAGSSGKGIAEQQPKQQKIPNEISTTVDTFTDFVKKQKSLAADVMRVSIKPLVKVSQQAEETTRAAVSLCGEAGRARAHSRRLRAAAARALAAAERAGRDVSGMESEGGGPPAYVTELLAELEAQLVSFRRQMDVADRQMQAPNRLLTEQELSMGMRRMHESLVALAGRLQSAHALVEQQKGKYLTLRRHLLKDTADVFRPPGEEKGMSSLMRGEDDGRRKKAVIPDVALSSAVLTDPRVALGSLQQATGPTPFTYLGSSLSTFPTSDNIGSSWTQPVAQPSFGASLNSSGLASFSADTTSSFQLQKPPGKRGKQ